MPGRPAKSPPRNRPPRSPANRLAQLPKNTAPLWNRYDFNPTVGVGLGIIHRGAIFASVDNAVALPAFTRFDAAVSLTLNPALQVQLNIENLGDKRYFASANSNNNISLARRAARGLASTTATGAIDRSRPHRGRLLAFA